MEWRDNQKVLGIAGVFGLAEQASLLLVATCVLYLSVAVRGEISFGLESVALWLPPKPSVMVNSNRANGMVDGGAGDAGEGNVSLPATGAGEGRADGGEAAGRQSELERLRRLVAQWNSSRLDLFEISEPNEVGGWAMSEHDNYCTLLTLIPVPSFPLPL